MDTGLVQLIVAAGCFVVTHFAMSGPLRARMVCAWREQGFLTVYSLVSIVTLGWTIVAFDRAPVTGAAWDGMQPVAWILGSILTIASLALLLPSFKRNPALPGVKAAGLGTVIPSGVFTITRHPMMWGVTLWALGHIVVAPTAPVFILMGALILVALLGSHFQDKRKIAKNKREFGRGSGEHRSGRICAISGRSSLPGLLRFWSGSSSPSCIGNCSASPPDHGCGSADRSAGRAPVQARASVTPVLL